MSKTPGSAKHTVRRASKSEYGLPKFQNKLWNESRVMPKSVRTPDESGNSVDSEKYILLLEQEDVPTPAYVTCPHPHIHMMIIYDHHI